MDLALHCAGINMRYSDSIKQFLEANADYVPRTA
jgi:hypothetical protein